MSGRATNAAIMASLFLTACGEAEKPVATPTPPSDSQQIVKLVQTFNTALADGDGARACATLDPAAQSELMDFYNESKEGTLRDQGLPDATSCVQAASGLTSVGYAVVKDAIADAKFATVEDVQIRGGVAQARSAASAGAAQVVRLARSGGGWTITKPPGF